MSRVRVYRSGPFMAWLSGRWTVWCPHCLEHFYRRVWCDAMALACRHAQHAPGRR